MPLYNPIYTRKQLGLSTNSGKTKHEELLINNDTLSDEQSNHPTESNSLLTFFSTLTASFRPQTRLKSSSKNCSHLSFPKTSRYYQNGLINHEKSNSIYHQLDIHTINDENNNQTEDKLHSQSITIDLLPKTSTQSDQCLTIDQNSKYLFTTKHLLWIFLLSILYFTWFGFLAGISMLHLIIYFIFLSFYFFSENTRRFVLAMLVYATYVIIYDALHLIPNYTVSKVHIRDVYLFEKKFFGIFHKGQLMTLNEYFKLNHIPFLDVFTGLCYLNWIPIPLVYSLYLYRYKTKRDFLNFAFTFLLTNILGFIIYYIVPSAPPWYVELYGFHMNKKAPGYSAGFENFDRITGIKIFSSIYSKNAHVFAAIPSLHAAYPLITVFYGSLSKSVWLHLGFVVFTLSVWFSAIYSRHHYALDVLAGGLCAVTAYLLYRLISRIPAINRLLVAYSKLI